MTRRRRLVRAMLRSSGDRGVRLRTLTTSVIGAPALIGVEQAASAATNFSVITT
jgi:hypothetical protein